MSVEEWLRALGLSRLAAGFDRAGITQTAQLYALTESKLVEAGVSLPGVRRRVLNASAALVGGG